MKRFFILLLSASLLLLLSDCTGMEMIYKETPSFLVSADLEAPMPEPSFQETVSAGPSASGQEDAGDDVSEDNSSADDYSPQAPASASPEGTEMYDDTQTEDEIGAPADGGAESIVTDTPAEPEEQITPDAGGQPPLLSQCILSAGLSFDSFAFSQLILVRADGSNADIYCYEKNDNGLWKLNDDLGYIAGYAGRNGVSTDKREGDGCTPGGLYRLGYAFGNKPQPPTGMAYRAITADSLWIDDPNSKYYNQWVEGMDGADWTSCEHLATNIVSYAYAVVVEYNTPPDTIAGKGSAIFFHIGNKPSSGCVVVTEETLLSILKWLSADENPSVLIVAK